jgi:hypothetical protein
MAFEALGDLLDESLRLPIDGRTYTIPAPSAQTGLRVQAIVQVAATAAGGGEVDEQALGDAAEMDLYRDLLGPAYDDMLADNVSWPALKHAARTVIVWIVQDVEAAERVWASGGDPSLLAPNREASRSSSAAANSTRSRGSTSGTKPRTDHRRNGRGGGARRA